MSDVKNQSLRFFFGSLLLWATSSFGFAQSNSDVILYASQAPIRSGTWAVVADPTAAGGYAIGTPALGAPLVKAPIANPANYF